MRVPTRDYLTDLAMGRVIEHKPGERRFSSDFTMYGYSEGVTNANFNPLADDNYLIFPQAPKRLRIKAGGNAADAAAGTGARSILIQGIDDNLDWVNETLVTNGASASALTNASFWRLNRGLVITVGTYGGTNTDDIVIEDEDGTEIATIKAGIGTTRQAIMSVPNGYTALVRGAVMGTESNKPITYRFHVRQGFNAVTAPFQADNVLRTVAGLDRTIPFEFGTYPIIPTVADLWVSAKLDTGTTAVGFMTIEFQIEPNGQGAPS